jgi:hypothetical protein
MQFTNLFRARTRWKCFVYSTFSVVCFAQSDPGSRGGPADFSTQLRSTSVITQTATSIKCVQGNYATLQTPQAVSVAFIAAQVGGDAASGKVGSAFSHQITATNAPTSYGATGLPAGLSANTGTEIRRDKLLIRLSFICWQQSALSIT